MARPTYPDLEMREAGTSRAKERSTLRSLITSLRPQQWTKNLVVLAALPFGLKLFDSAAVAMALAAFAVFCLLSGVVYLVNDLFDRENDRLHPTKRLRPIAAGDLSPGSAIVWAGILATAALGAAGWIGPAFAAASAAYLALFALYSRWLKHVVIIDVLSIAIGFMAHGLMTRKDGREQANDLADAFIMG
ncbi:MAG: UbiA family prenyltransferase, partial [Devosia sp.]